MVYYGLVESLIASLLLYSLLLFNLGFLLQPKNAKSREDLKKGMSDGIIIRGLGHQILSKELYQEAIIISDMYDMNEFTALDLLCTAQIRMSYYPGLPRGLVAVLLYYERRKALVTSLRYLVQARSGVQWCVDMKPEVEKFVTSYTDQLMEGGLFNSIFDLIKTLDLTKELEKLQENLALGGPRHRRQVIDLFQDVRNILADIVFTWAAHTGLPKAPTILLINYLKQAEIEEEASGKIDNVHLYLQMALLSALDLSVLHSREDGEEVVQCLPILSDPDYLLSIINELLPSKSKWKCEGLQAITNFGLAVCIASLQSLSQSQQFQEAVSKEEIFIDAAIEANVFGFLHNILLENETLYKETFLYKRMHYLISDFIVYMYRKVKELRIKADDIARTVQIYSREGLDAPSNLPRYFEYLLLSIGKFYGKKVAFGTEYVLSFWSTVEVNAGQYNSHRPSSRTVSLFKFIRLAGDMVPQTLFVPYLTMLSGLSTCQQAARHCFNILKQVGGVRLTASLSWDHFFMSFAQYYSNLRQEAPPISDTVYRNTYLKGVSPQELEGLHTVLLVMRTIADHDEFSRLALCEHPGWAPLSILLGLVGCSVPIPLKADLLLTLASLSKSSENAVQMWENLEASQILVTVPSTSSYIPRGIQTELEEIESSFEEYPLTRAVLKLLDVLTDFGIPRTLGAGPRPPGFDPYFTFIVNSVFLKFHTRSYRNVSEKWEIANLCLCLFEKFLAIYEPQVSDFPKKNVPHEFNSPPGYHLMIQMNTKSELLNSILDIIYEGTRLFDAYVDFPGKTFLIECTLRCLNIINLVLSLQEKFVAALTTSGNPILLTSLIKLLLIINRRSGRPDHCINIAKYINYQPYLLKHGLVACKILYQITMTSPMHHQFINVFLSSEAKDEIKQGFVLSLDSEMEDDSEEIIISTKLAIIKLLKHCLQYAAPNLSHFLFGFDLKKDISRTEFQYSGVLNFPRSCLHAIISLINLEMSQKNSSYSLLLESSYEILFLLASNGKTYGPVLRFLRFNKSFFITHLNNCYARVNESSCAMNQMSFLMKTLAVELKICGQSKQVSYLKQLTNYLVDLPQLVNNTNQDPYSTAFSDDDEVQFVSWERINNNFLVNLISYFEITPEFSDFLKDTSELDKKNEKCNALIQFVDAWRQVVEILVVFIPNEILTVKESQMIGVCFVLNLLKRVTKIQLLPEIGQLLSGAICLICEKLRKSQAQIHINFLKEILENLIEWIMVSNVTDEKLRVNLYASLSTLLDLASLDNSTENASLDGSTHVNRLNSPKLSLAKFGDRLIDVFCQDCIGGYEVAKMLALSSFGTLVTLSGNLNWIVYMSGRGYLKYIIQSILESDKDLEQILQPEQTSIKPLYVYMSKIFFLGRLVETRVGAELVLEQKIFSCFSNMIMFSLHPEISKTLCVEDVVGNFIPSPEELYLQMWLPTLELCNAVLTTLGTDNQSAAVQIMYFLINRLDVVETILRSGSVTLPQLFLKELALLTGVISRTANNNLVNILENPEIVHDQRVHLFKIQKLTLNLLPKFIISDEIAKELVMKPINNSHTFQTSDRLLYALQIASNLLSYSRNVVSNHDVEHGGIGVLFSPTLIDPTSHTTNLKKSSGFNDQTLPIGVIVQYLITTVSHYGRQKHTYTLLKERIQDPLSMDSNSKFLEDFIDESMSVIDVHSKKEHVRQLLSNILKKKQKEIQYCEFIIENALYLIWVHLDYYMSNAIPKMKNVGTVGGNLKSFVNTSSEFLYMVFLNYKYDYFSFIRVSR